MNSYDAYYLTCRTGVINLKLEKAISKDFSCSFCYAKEIIKSRFELGEELISQNCYFSWRYTIEVLKERFKLGENSMNMHYSNWHFNLYHHCYEILRYDHE